MSILFVRRRPDPPKNDVERSWDTELLSVMQEQWLTNSYNPQLNTTYGRMPAENIQGNFLGQVAGALYTSGVVFSVELIRVMVASEVRFQFQRLSGDGGTGDLFGNETLAPLEEPWPGGTTGDLVARAVLDADHAGTAYMVRMGDSIIRLRPDWCDLVLAPRMSDLHSPDFSARQIGYEKVGLFYFEGGDRAKDPAVFLEGEYAQFAPMPDPLATYRGMSWMTPVLREIAGDKLATEHGISFLEHGATPNMAITLPRETTQRQFKIFKAAYDQSRSASEAYSTLLLTMGAQPVPIGVNMKDLDMAKLRGISETRVAMAGGIHPVVLGSSEGMQGSSLNAGNYQAAKRSTADKTFRPLWRNLCGSLQPIVPPPAGARLWYDERDVAFLAEDVQDAATVSQLEATTINQLVTAGYEPASVVSAVIASNWKLLKHTGLFSVQLQPAGESTDSASDSTAGPSALPAGPPAQNDTVTTAPEGSTA